MAQTVVADLLCAQALTSEFGALRGMDTASGPPVFYLFLVPKASGGLRPILDLKRLNAYVKPSLSSC